MRIALLTLGLFLVSCASETPDLNPPDATSDVTLMDTGKADASTDATLESGGDAGLDGSVDDASDSGDAGDDSTTDSGIDTGILDGGDPDGSICPPCQMNFKCCMIMKSMNYGKCTNTACLACCM